MAILIVHPRLLRCALYPFAKAPERQPTPKPTAWKRHHIYTKPWLEPVIHLKSAGKFQLVQRTKSKDAVQSTSEDHQTISVQL